VRLDTARSAASVEIRRAAPTRLPAAGRGDVEPQACLLDPEHGGAG